MKKVFLRKLSSESNAIFLCNKENKPINFETIRIAQAYLDNNESIEDDFEIIEITEDKS